MTRREVGTGQARGGGARQLERRASRGQHACAYVPAALGVGQREAIQRLDVADGGALLEPLVRKLLVLVAAAAILQPNGDLHLSLGVVLLGRALHELEGLILVLVVRGGGERWLVVGGWWLVVGGWWLVVVKS